MQTPDCKLNAHFAKSQSETTNIQCSNWFLCVTQIWTNASCTNRVTNTPSVTTPWEVTGASARKATTAMESGAGREH